MSDDERLIDTALRRLTGKRRRIVAVRVFIVGVAIASGWMLLALLVDRWFHNRRAVRVGAEAVTAILLLGTIAQAFRLLLSRRFDPAQAARHAETVDPAWHERLSTAVTQVRLPATDRASPTLTAALIAEVAAELSVRPPVQAVRWAAVRPAIALLGGVVVAWLAALNVPLLELPRLAERHILSLADLPPVTGTQIELLPHSPSIPQGNSLSIVADLNRDVGPVTLNVGPDLQHLQPLPMLRTYALRYSATLIAPQNDFVYRVTAGDAVTAAVNVRVLRTPGVSELDADLVFPDGRPPLTINSIDGDLHLPAGTRVTATFHTTDPLRSATVHVGSHVVAAQPTGDKRIWTAEFVARESGAWSIQLIGEQGTHGRGPAGMLLKVD